MTDDEQLQQWETDGGLSVFPNMTEWDKFTRAVYALDMVQENQYDIQSQKVRR